MAMQVDAFLRFFVWSCEFPIITYMQHPLQNKNLVRVALIVPIFLTMCLTFNLIMLAVSGYMATMQINAF